MLHDNNNTHYIYNNRTRSDAIQLSPYIFQTKWFVIEAVINPGDARETCSHDRRCSCRDFVISAQTHAEATTHLCAQFCTHKIAGFLHTRSTVCVCVCATDACSIWVCPNAAKCASVPLISIWCKSIEPTWWVLCFFCPSDGQMGTRAKPARSYGDYFDHLWLFGTNGNPSRGIPLLDKTKIHVSAYWCAFQQHRTTKPLGDTIASLYICVKWWSEVVWLNSLNMYV